MGFPSDLAHDLSNTQSSFTALMYCAQKGHTDCMRLLLKHGANTNAAGKDVVRYLDFERTRELMRVC